MVGEVLLYAPAMALRPLSVPVWPQVGEVLLDLYAPTMAPRPLSVPVWPQDGVELAQVQLDQEQWTICKVLGGGNNRETMQTYCRNMKECAHVAIPAPLSFQVKPAYFCVFFFGLWSKKSISSNH